MKWMIASDIHGASECCKKMLERFDTEQADRLLLLGDILYHGPRNELPADYSPKQTAALLNERKDNLFCVRGNCDTEVDQMVLEFPLMAEYALLEWEKRLIFASHGHHYNLEQPPCLRRGDILLNGHTHVPAIAETSEGWFYLNPGSVSIPKEDSTCSYLILDEGTIQLKELDGSLIQEKMLKNG